MRSLADLERHLQLKLQELKHTLKTLPQHSRDRAIYQHQIHRVRERLLGLVWQRTRVAEMKPPLTPPLAAQRVGACAGGETPGMASGQ